MLRTAARVLTFRASREDLAGLGTPHLAFGLLCVWLVGMGRYWDHPNAHALQYAGLGSLVYVAALSLLLFVVGLPLRPRDWSYRRVLTFVALTAPPAALYAIPVERFMDLKTAQFANVLFLAAVALWRAALWAFFLRRWAGLGGLSTATALLLPLMAIVATLAFLNLERVVFEIMAGNPSPGTPHDGAYVVLIVLTFLSAWGVLPVLLMYVAQIILVRRATSGSPRSPSA